MQKIILISILISVAINHALFAQQPFIVPAGESPDKLLPKSLRLLSRSFDVGHLIYWNNIETKSYYLNIDLYCGCIVYINDRSDTTFVTNILNIKGLTIGEKNYAHIPKTGFMEVLASNSMYKLVSHTQLVREQIEEQVNVGYGSVSARAVTSAVKSVRMQTDAKFYRKTEWFLLDHRITMIKADKRNFLKMFREKEDQIRSITKSQKIDYKDKDDLIKLFSVCIAQ